MSVIKVGAIQNQSGVEVYTSKSWVNFNGTGTVGIRGAGNVTSITDNGVGDYTANFTTAIADTNYAATMTAARADPAAAEQIAIQYGVSTSLTTSCRLQTRGGGGVQDSLIVALSVTR